ncbi:kinase-like domain-containing protein [Paraphysoderma sedebokerense]|nr:kinase-like domain-containing protein [Paraphysoderma sedebokerense]
MLGPRLFNNSSNTNNHPLQNHIRCNAPNSQNSFPYAAIRATSFQQQHAYKIQDFHVGEILGTGGFGCVYKAQSELHPFEGKELAIKMIDKQKIKAANLKQRVANEVEIHKQLSHPSILSLFTFFEDSDNVYLVMELCENGELYTYLQNREKPLNEAEARFVLIQVIKGLMYLHSRGIIHRDLKLSNLLLTRDYDVKIADFGLATKVQGPTGEQKTMCGTPNYISPEIVSRQPYSFAADVWSLGCLMVTLLTGKPPFESEQVLNTLNKVSRADYTLPDTVSFDARNLIQRLLQLDPKKRLPLDRILHQSFFKADLLITRLLPVHLVNLPEAPISHIEDQDVEMNGAGLPYSHRAADNKETLRNHSVQSYNPPVESYILGANASVRPSSSISSVPTQHRVNQQQSYQFQSQPTQPLNEQYSHQTPQSTSGPHDNNIGATRPSSIPYSHQSSHSNAKSNASSNSNAFQSYNHASNGYSNSGCGAKQPTESQLQPLTTRRLKPMKQSTKYGHVEILKCGNFVLDFGADKYLMVISGDGRKINFFEKSLGSYLSSHGVSSDLLIKSLRTYDLQQLPEKYWKKYKYAVRFVHLVKSKTAKIIFYSPQAKCILMENSPHPDFEMHFYNNSKAHLTTSDSQLTIKIPTVPSSSSFEPPQSTSSQYRYKSFSINLSDPDYERKLNNDPTLILMVTHIKECMRQCMDIERSGKLDGNIKYPLILKSSSCTVVRGTANGGMNSAPFSSTNSQGSGETRTPSSGARRSKTMCSTIMGSVVTSNTGHDQPGILTTTVDQHTYSDQRCVPSHSSNSALSTSSRTPLTSIATKHSSNQNYQQQPQQSLIFPITAPSQCPPSVVSSTSYILPPQSTISQYSQPTRHPFASSSSTVPSAHPSERENIENIRPPDLGLKMFDLNNTVFLPNIGWCIKHPDGSGMFTMLFVDGVVVMVESKKQMLWVGKGECESGLHGVKDGAGELLRYTIDKNLPEEVKPKLSYFPKFVEIFNSRHKH